MQVKYLSSTAALLAALVTGGCEPPDGTTLTSRFEAAASVAAIAGTGETATDRANGGPSEPFAAAHAESPGGQQPADEDFGLRSELPRPSSMSTREFEAHLFPFLKSRRYVDLGWRRDKSVRDTGPYIKGIYYGTHPAVRVYYSPGIMRWLVGGRRGEIPDGEMIIKEQFAPPAARHHDKDEQQLHDALQSWTVMIKDAQGSHDGWFWSNPGASAEVIDYRQRNEQPASGFGLYCIRCHASTQSPAAADAPGARNNEFTFAALRNIEGFAGEPILFRVDDSWWMTPGGEGSSEGDGESAGADGQEANSGIAKRDVQPDPDFTALYHSVAPQSLESISFLPSSAYDCVPAQRASGDQESGGAREFLTSDQCMNCHAGLTGPFGPVGFVHTSDDTSYGAAGVNVSPYGEWAWTPMGLAGRDPIFHAQLESEVAMIRKQFGEDAEARALTDALVDACLRCHGAMGHHEFHRTGGPEAKFSHESLTRADVDDGGLSQGRRGTAEQLTPTAAAEQLAHGALARDGISCMVCHRAQPRPQAEDDTRPYLEYFLETSITGNLHFGPPGEIYGPYKDDEIAAYAMHHGIGMQPRHSNYIRTSQMCGSCHTVSLPTIDRPLSADPSEAEIALAAGETVAEFKRYGHHLEQATYLEWLNSEYNNESDPANSLGQSCQSCHMSNETYADEAGDRAGPIRTRIAAIQDDTYPDAENLAPHEDLRIRLREDYRRHDFAGLNIGLVELFKQFAGELGVKSNDYMTGSDHGAEQAIAGMARTARERTATVEVTARVLERAASDEPPLLEAQVRVSNLAGHRFPSGVGFRRAFIELRVTQDGGEGEQLVWASGRTNSMGVITGDDGRPLDSEFFADHSAEQAFQPHHQVITSQDQVQIYETLLKDNRGRFTTSFVRGCETVKDNRLLPKGWTPQGPGGGLTGVYLKATHPGPIAGEDSDFVDGSGSDDTLYRIQLPLDVDPQRLRVQATLYYQATPPYYLNNLFTTAPQGDATRRLHALASRLQLTGTPLEGWKLKIAAASVKLARDRPDPLVKRTR